MNRRRKIPLAVLGIGIVESFSSSALADDQAAFEKLLSDPAQQQRVVSSAGRSTVLMQNPCPSARFSLQKKLFIYRQPTFDSAGNIGDGAWKHVVDEQGCGTSRVLNVMVSAEGPSNVSFVPLLPGTTRADPLLQKDAVRFAVQAAATAPGGREADCQIGYVADTEFIEQESKASEGAKGPSWRELWTVASCIQKILVPMHFVPVSTGTSIAAGPTAAIKVIPSNEVSP